MITIVYLSMSLYSFDERILQFYSVDVVDHVKLSKTMYNPNAVGIVKLPQAMYRVDVVDPVKLTRNPLSTHNCTINTGFESSSYLHKSIAL